MRLRCDLFPAVRTGAAKRSISGLHWASRALGESEQGR